MCPRAFLNGGHRALIHVLEQKRSQMLSTNYSLALCKKVAIWSKWCLDSFKFNNKKKKQQPKKRQIELKEKSRKKNSIILYLCDVPQVMKSTMLFHQDLSLVTLYLEIENWVFSVYMSGCLISFLSEFTKKVMWHNWLSFSEPSNSITYHS